MIKTNHIRLFLFLLSAGISGVIYFGLLYVCRNIFTVNPYVSVSIAYCASMAFYFVTNKLVVFSKIVSSNVWLELIGFLPLALFNYIVTLIIVALLRRYTHEEYSGSVVAGIVTTAMAYLVFDKLLFKNNRH